MARRFSKHATIAARFGLNPWQLEDWQRDVLLSFIPKLDAEKLLERWRNGEVQLTASGLYNATLQATGDKELSEETRNAFIREQLRRGEKVE